MTSLRFGDITVDTLSDGYLDLDLAGFFPDAPAETWHEYRDGIAGDKLRCALTTFVIRTAGQTLLVDTGLGPRLGGFQGESGRLPQALAAAGIRPEQVNAVVATHLHPDHIGWNCTLVGEHEFRPTFANARYFMSTVEWDRWKDTGQRFLDRQIKPLFASGQMTLVEDGYEPAPGLRLLATPGHTAGHVSVLVYCAGEGGVITGDAMHHPVEIEHPGWSPGMDDDRQLSARSRLALVERIEAEGLTVLGGHFPAPHAGRIVRVEQRRIYRPLGA